VLVLLPKSRLAGKAASSTVTAWPAAQHQRDALSPVGYEASYPKLAILPREFIYRPIWSANIMNRSAASTLRGNAFQTSICYTV
jgi:hypothetical protein